MGDTRPERGTCAQPRPMRSATLLPPIERNLGDATLNEGLRLRGGWSTPAVHRCAGVRASVRFSARSPAKHSIPACRRSERTPGATRTVACCVMRFRWERFPFPPGQHRAATRPRRLLDRICGQFCRAPNCCYVFDDRQLAYLHLDEGWRQLSAADSESFAVVSAPSPPLLWLSGP